MSKSDPKRYDTTKIYNNIEEALKALTQIREAKDPKKIAECCDTLELVVRILEHKTLRISELERELQKLKSGEITLDDDELEWSA